MTAEQRLNQFVQDVYLTRYNRFIDDITDEDGLIEVQKTVRYANMFIEEIRDETDPDGRPVDWDFLRENDEEIGTISSTSQIFELPDEVYRLVVDAERPLILMFDGSIIARFEVVDANQLSRRVTGVIPDRVTVVNNNLVFSRLFSDYEIGSTVVADTIHDIPELVATPPRVTLLDTVPYQLLVLGVAKNATLPDIVQGGLSPSFVQKYADELKKAITKNSISSTSDEVVRDDYGSIAGIY